MLGLLDDERFADKAPAQVWAILTHAFLSVMAATKPPTADEQTLIRLTRNQIRRLLSAAITLLHSIEHTVNWSTWRRQHQARARARTSHYAQRATRDE